MSVCWLQQNGLWVQAWTSATTPFRRIGLAPLAQLYYTILYYTIPYHTILYYTILYYTILYYTILYYTTILI